MHLKLKTDNQLLHNQYSNLSNGYQGDSGMDLYTPQEYIIPRGAISFKINLGVSCEAFVDRGGDVATSFYLFPRSSTGSKTPLRLSNSVGVIDSGYRGNLIAIVDNRDLENDFIVEQGSRLFQICSPTLSTISFELTNQLSETERGSGGFGSTGS